MKQIETGSSSRGETVEEVACYNAVSYLKEVKETFKDEEGKYERFLEAMKVYKSQSVIAGVKELLKGHNNLIIGLNTFLPERDQITVTEEEPRPVNYEDAVKFINKIKEHFSIDDPVFISLREILLMYGRGDMVINDVLSEITALLSSYPDLLADFVKLLPDNPPQTDSEKQNRTVTPNSDDKRTSAEIEAGRSSVAK